MLNKRKIRILCILFMIFSISISMLIYSNLNINGFKDDENKYIQDLDSPLKLSNNPPNYKYFSYYKEITINHLKVAEDLTDFPLLISIDDSDLHTEVQANGNDIAFSNGTDWLDYEIELFDQDYDATHARLIAWIRVPSISSSTDTKIYMYYGNSTMTARQNPTGVWTSNYKAVWHLNTTLLDSTSNNNDGTNSGADDVSALIGNGRDYNGAASNGDYSNMGSGSSIDNIFNGGATISAWIYPEGWGGGNYGRVLAKSSVTDGSDGWVLCVDGISPATQQLIFFRGIYDSSPPAGDSRGLWYTGDYTVNPNQWNYVTITYDDSVCDNYPIIYINNNMWDISNLSIDDPPPEEGYAQDDSSQSVYIGNYGGAAKDRTFDGPIDEVRISSGIKSFGWIKTEFNNQNDPDSFYSISVAISIDTIPPNVTINSPHQNDLLGDTAPNFNVTINDNGVIDKMWYRLLNGTVTTVNTTFTTNGTISQTRWDEIGNGTVTIQFFANDSSGNIGFSEVIVRKDIYYPTIIINSPSLFELFGVTAPNFNVEVKDVNGVDDMWYTLNNGIETYFTTNGTISQSAWDLCGNGTVSIKFYSNDSLGNEGFSEVIVRKEVESPTIQINFPNSYDLFGKTPPNFNVEIYDNNTVDDMWYTLNNGIETYFTTNGSISQSAWNAWGNGTVSIKFYANNSLGNTDFSEVIVRKDVINPGITINSPDDYDLYGKSAPSFNVIITDPNGIESKWYTLDGGNTNTTFTSNGIINQTRWDEMGSGTIVLRFYARDNVGNIGFSDVYIDKDIDSPNITVNAPTPYEVFGVSSPSFNVEIVDSSGINSMWYSINDGINITFTSNGTINQALWSLEGNGTVSIKFYGKDSLGNEGFLEVIVRKDINPPSIQINSPNAYELFNEIAPTFNVEIWDINTVDEMWYTLNNGIETYFTTNGSISQSAWDICGNGTVSIKFYANDSLGNEDFSEVIVRKEIGIPSITINYPYDFNLFGKTAPNFNVEIWDSNGIDTMWYTLNNGIETYFTTNGTISQSAWNAWGNGTVSIKFYANNSLGGEDFSEVIVRKDVINPGITINSPDDYDLYGKSAPSFNVIITDPNGIESKWYTLDGGNTNTTFTSNGIINQTRWDEMGSGTIVLRFYARDNVGNIGFSDVYIDKDIDSPNITVNAPTPYEVFGVSSPSFNVEIVDSSGINSMWYSINDGINITFTSNGTINQALWSLEGNGTVSIKFYGKDSLGNEGLLEVIVRKDINPPSIQINSPSPYELFNEIAPAFNVEIWDSNGIDTMWYTLDGGNTNTTFTSNGSISQSVWDICGNGTVSIKFYANDSLGNQDFSEVIVRKEIGIPSIQINSPNPYELFNEIAPTFNVEIWDSNG
ncbi:MAG: DUF2341 domain-containing protein, partial [Candidatus Thorarchaeota archaeon]